jgi:hypothetical protein
MSHRGFPGVAERCWSPLKMLFGRFSSCFLDGTTSMTAPNASLVGLTPTPELGEDDAAVGGSCFCCFDFRNMEPPPET